MVVEQAICQKDYHPTAGPGEKEAVCHLLWVCFKVVIGWWLSRRIQLTLSRFPSPVFSHFLSGLAGTMAPRCAPSAQWLLCFTHHSGVKLFFPRGCGRGVVFLLLFQFWADLFIFPCPVYSNSTLRIADQQLWEASLGSLGWVLCLPLPFPFFSPLIMAGQDFSLFHEEICEGRKAE